MSWFWLAFFIIHTTAAQQNPNEKCEFKYTVDLTNETPFENGSYLHQNIVIPREKWGYYNYRLEFDNKLKPANLHVRGCICDVELQIYCIRLCCDRGHYFDENSARCQQLPESKKSPTEMQILVPGEGQKKVNIFDQFVIQVDLPCATPEMLWSDEWKIIESGELLIFNKNLILDTVSYCITPHMDKRLQEYSLVPMSCPVHANWIASISISSVQIYGLTISTFFLILTILVYVLLKELRDNLRGKLLTSYLISITTANGFLICLVLSPDRFDLITCSILGFAGYFFFMSTLTWLSVLGFDIWNNFKKTNIGRNSKQNMIRFLLYSMYAWGLAAAYTGLAMWAQLSDSVPDFYKPGIGNDICYLDSKKWSAAFYFYLPNFIIFVFNMIIFIRLTLRIYRVRRDVRDIRNAENFEWEYVIVTMRLFLMMDIYGIVIIASYCLQNYKGWAFLYDVTEFYTNIQGIFIFILFVLKPNVLALLKANFGKTKHRRGSSTMTLRSRITSTVNASSP